MRKLFFNHTKNLRKSGAPKLTECGVGKREVTRGRNSLDCEDDITHPGRYSKKNISDNHMFSVKRTESKLMQRCRATLGGGSRRPGGGVAGPT